MSPSERRREFPTTHRSANPHQRSAPQRPRVKLRIRVRGAEEQQVNRRIARPHRRRHAVIAHQRMHRHPRISPPRLLYIVREIPLPGHLDQHCIHFRQREWVGKRDRDLARRGQILIQPRSTHFPGVFVVNGRIGMTPYRGYSRLPSRYVVHHHCPRGATVVSAVNATIVQRGFRRIAVAAIIRQLVRREAIVLAFRVPRPVIKLPPRPQPTVEHGRASRTRQPQQFPQAATRRRITAQHNLQRTITLIKRAAPRRGDNTTVTVHRATSAGTIRRHQRRIVVPVGPRDRSTRHKARRQVFRADLRVARRHTRARLGGIAVVKPRLPMPHHPRLRPLEPRLLAPRQTHLHPWQRLIQVQIHLHLRRRVQQSAPKVPLRIRPELLTAHRLLVSRMTLSAVFRIARRNIRIVTLRLRLTVDQRLRSDRRRPRPRPARMIRRVRAQPIRHLRDILHDWQHRGRPPPVLETPSAPG